MQRRPHTSALLLLVALASLISPARAQSLRPNPARHAVIQLKGDLDARRTADQFRDALATLDEQSPRLILLELGGDRTRPDLLFDAVRALRACETPTAVWLADPADRRVAPGMLALALAAESRGVHTTTRIVRTPDDDLTHLSPETEDWAVVRLDLRSLARDIADSGPLEQTVVESALAPRTPLWIVRDPAGLAGLTPDEPPADPIPLVTRDEAGWSFDTDAPTAADLYGMPIHRTRRAFERALGLRGRPIETIEIESGLRPAHAEARTLVDRVRDAVRLADAALDVRAGRSATSRVMPHEYHAAAARARPLVEQSRAAIAEIAGLCDDWPELLEMDPPPDDDAPTELGEPARTNPSAWRRAVRDAEYDLSRLDDRIETYERR